MKNDLRMGWDAAWTPGGSGAWAICRGRELLLWEMCPKGDERLSKLNDVISKWHPGLIAMDFPLAKSGVTGWRVADLETTRAFTRYRCPVHSPSPERPGVWGNKIMEVLTGHGYELATSRPLPELSVVEVYPHTALLKLHRSRSRIPYKAGRSATYWPELSLPERKRKLQCMHRELYRRLQERFDLPALLSLKRDAPLSQLKRREDLLDALVCLYAAEEVALGRFQPFGDEEAAIWNPVRSDLPQPA